jgi:hypothetical protein
MPACFAAAADSSNASSDVIAMSLVYYSRDIGVVDSKHPSVLSKP